MAETQSDTDRYNTESNQSFKNDRKIDNTMVLLIGLKFEQCDTKEFMKLCDRKIGITQLVTFHSVESLDMPDEHIQQYKEDGCNYCAVVLFRTYKRIQQNYKLQRNLLLNGLTHVTLEDEKYVVTHRRGFAW